MYSKKELKNFVNKIINNDLYCDLDVCEKTFIVNELLKNIINNIDEMMIETKEDEKFITEIKNTIKLFNEIKIND